jgi:hypothetical protein
MSAALWASASAPLLAQDADPATELDAPREAEPALAVTPVVYVAPHLNLGREDHGTGSVFGTWGSVGFFSGNLRNDAATVAMFDLGMRIGLGTDASLTVDWGLAVAATRVRGEYVTTMMNTPYDVQTERVEARNADFTFEFSPQLANNVRLNVGLGVAVPVAAGAQAPATNTQGAAQIEASNLVHDVYLAANAGWYAWRYRAERGAVFVPLGTAIGLSAETTLVIEGAAALSFPILGGVERSLSGDVMLAADIRYQMPVHLLRDLSIGARVSIAALDLGVSSSTVQPAVEPWVRYRITDVSLLLRGSLPFAGRYGIGSDFPGWGVHLGASVDVR